MNSFFSKFMIYFGFAMVACYLGIASYLLFSDAFDYVDINMRMVFAIFFYVYGLYRLVRIINKIRHKDYENEQ